MLPVSVVAPFSLIGVETTFVKSGATFDTDTSVLAKPRPLSSSVSESSTV
jgi:hypothetical protein